MARPRKYGLCFVIATIMIVFFLLSGRSLYLLAWAQGKWQWGARLSGIADDMSAVYWNPAGLALLQRSGFHITSTLNNRDTFNYDDFLVYVCLNATDLLWASA